MSMKKKDVNKLIAEWMYRLGLQDWRIEIVYECTPEEIPIPEATGCTSWVESTKTAYIRILDEKYYGSRVAPFDFEEILVHELMHLKMCLLDFEDDEGLNTHSRVLHQIVDEMARALIDAKRGGTTNARPGENTKIMQRTGETVEEGAGLEVRSADEQCPRCVRR